MLKSVRCFDLIVHTFLVQHNFDTDNRLENVITIEWHIARADLFGCPPFKKIWPPPKAGKEGAEQQALATTPVK